MSRSNNPLSPGISMLQNVLVGLLVGFLVTQVAIFSTTVYLHRGLAHRALTMTPWLEAVFKTVIWLSTGMRPREWVAVHRKHHAFTDEVEDPHSPVQLGWLRVQLTNAALYRRVARDGHSVERYARDLPITRADRMLFDRAFVGLGIGVAGLIVLLGWQAGLVASLAHVVLYLGLSGSVNSVAHTFGSRTYDTSATNLQWLALLTAGEGLHNNHHAAPTSARFSLNKHELDPSWRPIRLMQRLGWLQVRHESPKFVAPQRTKVG